MSQESILREALNKAQSALRSGNIQDAEKYFKVVSDEDPANKEAKDGLEEIRVIKVKNNLDKGQRALKESEFKTAQQLFEEALQLDAQNPAALQGLEQVRAGRIQVGLRDGQDVLAKGEFDVARSYFNNVLSLDPTNLNAQSGLQHTNYQEQMYHGHQTLKARGYNKAADYFHKARGIDPQSEAEIYENIALGYQALEEKRWVNAQDSFEKALKIAPDNPQAKAGRYDAYFKAGEEAETAKHRRQAIGLYGVIAAEKPEAAARMRAVQLRLWGMWAAGIALVLFGCSVFWGVTKEIIRVPEVLCVGGACTPTPTFTATFTPTPTSTATATPTSTFTPTPTPTSTFTPTPTPTSTYTPTPVPFKAKARFENTGYYADVELQNYQGSLGKDRELYVCAEYSEDRYLISDDYCHLRDPLGWAKKANLELLFVESGFPKSLVTPGPILAPKVEPTSTATEAPKENK